MNNIIKINIKKKDDYVSKYNDDILSKELSNYIIEESRIFPLKSNICIEVTSNYDMDDLEKEKFINMIRTNFSNEIKEMLFYRKKNIIIDFFMFIFGIISLIIYFISSSIPVLSEFILVFSWVLIWESAHNLIFSGFSNKVEIERKKMITNCMIVFK